MDIICVIIDLDIFFSNCRLLEKRASVYQIKHSVYDHKQVRKLRLHNLKDLRMMLMVSWYRNQMLTNPSDKTTYWISRFTLTANTCYAATMPSYLSFPVRIAGKGGRFTNHDRDFKDLLYLLDDFGDNYVTFPVLLNKGITSSDVSRLVQLGKLIPVCMENITYYKVRNKYIKRPEKIALLKAPVLVTPSAAYVMDDVGVISTITPIKGNFSDYVKELLMQPVMLSKYSDGSFETQVRQPDADVRKLSYDPAAWAALDMTLDLDYVNKPLPPEQSD